MTETRKGHSMHDTITPVSCGSLGYDEEDDQDPRNHDYDCTCIFCIPGA